MRERKDEREDTLSRVTEKDGFYGGERSVLLRKEKGEKREVVR